MTSENTFELPGYFPELLKLQKANVMLSNGQTDKLVDVLFFYNHAEGDYTGLFEIAGATFHKSMTRFIAVTNNEGEKFGSTVPFEANPGKTECIRHLTEEEHIPTDNIIVPETYASHTQEENDAFLKLSQKNNWLTGIILAQPHRILRAMLGMLQAMEHGGYMMEIYTATPNSTRWREEVHGSQGAEIKPRFEHIPGELERVYRYLASGELATFEQLFGYLKAREEGSLTLGPIDRGSDRLTGYLPPDYRSG